MKKVSLKSLSRKAQLLTLGFTSLVLVGAALTPTIKQIVTAQTCNSIAQCQAQISSNNSAVAALRNTAASYQDAINHLNAQISQLQAAIDDSTAQQNKLQAQIVAGQQEIARQKAILASDVKAMYVDGTPSTIEVLATSKNLSEFVDKQEYRSAVQNKLQETLKEIAELQKQLQIQKVAVDALLVQQSSQKAELASAYAEQASLLAYNESQQASYNAQTSQNKNKLAALIAAQRAANNDTSAGAYFIRFPGDVGSFNPDNYPYRNAGFGMSPGGCVDNDGPDEWGYCTRQCVSFAAWAVQASGREAPRFYGDAKMWIAAARARGIPVYTSNPQPGDVMITTGGNWGHAMYVADVTTQGIHVIEYNQRLDGRLRTDRWL